MTPSPEGLLERHAAASVREARADTRIVVVNGARQAGKSTLANEVARERHGSRALTLDDPAVLEAARRDPVGFLEHDGTVLIDEIQRAPELFLPLKASVDRDPRPGRFLLTGSADVLTVPRLAEALTGRPAACTTECSVIRASPGDRRRRHGPLVGAEDLRRDNL